MGKIDNSLRNLIILKRNQGASFRQICTELNLAYSTVRNLWIKFVMTKSVSDLAKSGRPSKCTVREKRLISRISRKNPFLTAREVATNCNILNRLSVSTVRRYLRADGLFARRASRKPFLSKKNIRNRKKWCSAYLEMDPEKWKTFIFSDEVRFQTYPNISRLVRRPCNSRYSRKYIVETIKYGGSAIMVWGAIKADGSRVLVRCPKRLNSMGYVHVLESGLFQVYTPQSVFVQDNAPCHKSRSTLTYLDHKHVCMLADWPPQSPDINIIENIWSILKAKVQKRSPKSENELWAAIEQEYYSIDDSVIIDLYASIPRRLQAVLEAKGEQTKY